MISPMSGRLRVWLAISAKNLCSFALLGSGSSFFAEAMADWRRCLTLYTMRNFARLRILDPIFRRMNRAIAEEDREIVESSDPPIVPSPELERSVGTDLPTLSFRRIWRSRLRGSSAHQP